MSKIYVAPNKLKNRVYNELKKHCYEHGFLKENSSELSLLVPAGITINSEELLKMVKEFLQGYECIIVVEPITEFSDCLLKAGYKHYNDELPQFHAHILIKDEDIDVPKLKEKWFNLVGKSKKRLFHFEPIRESIREYLNYITKYFEEKYDAEPIYSFIIKRAEQKEEDEISHDEQVSFYVSCKRTLVRLFQKLKVSRLLSKFLFTAVLLIWTSSMLNLNLYKFKLPPVKYQIKVE